MSDQLQKKATVRKAIYLGVIVGLFTLSMFWRGVIPLPVGDPLRGGEADPRAVDKIARWPVRYQADDLELRELDMGDPEIAGSAAQISLVGFRGVVVTLLWKHAIDKQKRGEYHDMELAARMVSRMQPHFIEPWIFQAWNIAYNVSVENDKLGDQYFYIARGISLLAEGDRINTRLHRRGGAEFRVGSPDIRYQLAFYYQNKFTVSDKVATLRSLAQLSCIPPAERDPTKLVDRDTGRVDPARFLTFCQKHPQLVRRLQYSRKNPDSKQTEGMNLKTPEQVVQFLAANQTIPARYDAAGRDLPDEDAFPVFPRTDPLANPELDTYVRGALGRARPTADQKPVDNLDPVQAAHAWFEYGQEVVPPPVRAGETTGTPTGMIRKGEYDEFRYRIPTRPALIVFRSAPARSQTYLAERLQKEGWIDSTSYWEPDAAADVKWFPKANENDPPVRLFAGQNAKEEWGRTRNLWVRYGRLNGMNVEDRQKQEELAEITVRAGMGPLGGPPNRDYTREDLEAMGVPESAMRARMAVMYFDQNRQITNYQFFLDSSALETDPRVAEVRQMLWDADRLHETGVFAREIEVRVAAAAKWRDAVGSGLHQAFYAGDRAETYHEFTLEQENKLTKLLEDTDPVLQKRMEDARLSTLMLGGQAADVYPLFQRNLPYEEAVTRIAMAMPSAQVEQRVAELMNAAKDLQGVKATAEATRRGVIDREFAWMKEYAEPPPPPPGRRPWVRQSVRFTYLFKMGLASPTTAYSDERRPGTPSQGMTRDGGN